MTLKIHKIRILIFLIGNMCYSQSTLDLLSLSKAVLSENVTIKRNVIALKDAEANVQIERSLFDYNLFSDLSYQATAYHLFTSDPRYNYLDKVLSTNTWDFTGGVRKKLRSSQIIEVASQFNYNNSNSPFNSFSQEVPPFQGDYSGTVNLSLTQPLLKGRGKRIATIPEKVAELVVEIREEQNIHSASYQLTNTVSAYWSYYTAYRSLEIYKQNEARVKRVLEITNDLITADKKPAGDLIQIRADLANQEKLTEQAEQNLFSRRISVANISGLSAANNLSTEVPIDEYPIIENYNFNTNLSPDYFIQLAIDNRADLAGVKKNILAIELQNELAKDNLKPELNLSGFVFYGNTSQGNSKPLKISTLFGNEGRYIGGGARLTFNFSPSNNYNEGNYLKSQAALQDQYIVKNDLERVISLNVRNALNNYISTTAVLKKARETLENYKTAFENEESKFQMGLTTLLNVILFQERLTSAELEYLRAQEDFAVSIVNLRHETGTLLTQKNSSASLTKELFYKIPFQQIQN